MKHASLVYWLLLISFITFSLQQDNSTLVNSINNDININNQLNAQGSDVKTQVENSTETISIKPIESARLSPSNNPTLISSVPTQPVIATLAAIPPVVVQNDSIIQTPSTTTAIGQVPLKDDTNSIITQAPVATISETPLVIQNPNASVIQSPLGVTPQVIPVNTVNQVPNDNAIITQAPVVIPKDTTIIIPNDSSRMINQAPVANIPQALVVDPHILVTGDLASRIGPNDPIAQVPNDLNVVVTQAPTVDVIQTPIANPQTVLNDSTIQIPKENTVINQTPIIPTTQTPIVMFPNDSNGIINQIPVAAVTQKPDVTQQVLPTDLTVRIPNNNSIITQAPVDQVPIAQTPIVTIPNNLIDQVSNNNIAITPTPIASVVQTPESTIKLKSNDSTVQTPNENTIVTQTPISSSPNQPQIILNDSKVQDPNSNAVITQIPIALAPLNTSSLTPNESNSLINQAPPSSSVMQIPIDATAVLPVITQVPVTQTPILTTQTPLVTPEILLNDSNTIITQIPVASVTQVPTPTVIPNDSTALVTQIPISSEAQARVTSAHLSPNDSVIQAPVSKDSNTKIEGPKETIIQVPIPTKDNPQSSFSSVVQTPTISAKDVANDSIVQVPSNNLTIMQIPSSPMVDAAPVNSNVKINQAPIVLTTPQMTNTSESITQVPSARTTIEQVPTTTVMAPQVSFPNEIITQKPENNVATIQVPVLTPQVEIVPIVGTQPTPTIVVPIGTPVAPVVGTSTIDIPTVNANATVPNITTEVPQIHNTTVAIPEVIPNVTVPNITFPNITIPNIEIPTINSPRIDSSSIPLLNTPLISDALNHISQQSPINQVAGPGITDPGANAVSTSTSQANNIKNIIASFQDLNYFGGNTLNQAYTIDQIAALALLNSQLGLNNMATLPGQLAEDFNIGDQIAISPIIQGKCVQVDWKATGMLANDIGVGSQGDTYAAGIDGHLYFYDFLNSQWKQVTGDFDLGSITRVDVGPDGTPYVVTQSGNTYYLNEYNEWILLPGCGSDIAIGRGGEIYKIGCDLNLNGYGIYRLFKSEQEEKKGKKKPNCKCIRKRGYCQECSKRNKKFEEKSQYWFKLSGSGIKLSISPSGMPYITNSSGMILSYEKSNWKPILAGGFARDISVSNDGELFYIDIFHNIFRIINRQGFVYQLCGIANEIASGPFSQPFIIGTDHNVYTASKHIFN